MPTYEYRCPEGHSFDKLQKMSEKPRAACPVCGKPATRRISGGAGLVFKGTGFYITDYGKDGKGPRKAGEGEKGAADKPADKATAEKSDTKAEPKAGDKPNSAASPAKSEKPEKAPKKAAE